MPEPDVVEQRDGAKMCRWCNKARVKVMQIRGGKFLPFEYDMVKIDEAAGHGWVPMRDPQRGIFLRPSRELSDYRLQGVTWVALLHRCAEYEIARMRVNSMDWADEWTRTLLMTLQNRGGGK